MPVSTYTLLVTGGVMLLDWYATARKMFRLRVITKPLALLLLIAWFVVRTGPFNSGLLFTGAALVFSLLGDILLLRKVEEVSPRFFQAGLAAFLVAQVCYVAAFNLPAPQPTPAGLLALLFVAVVAVFFGRQLLCGLRRNAPCENPLPLVVYMLAISLMLASGLATLFRSDWPFSVAAMAAAGSALFFLSDSILAYKRFVHPVRMGEPLVMVTYHLAQIALTAALLIRFG